MVWPSLGFSVVFAILTKLRARHARLACAVRGAVIHAATAGTRRSDAAAHAMLRVSAVGISGLQAGEDVNML